MNSEKSIIFTDSRGLGLRYALDEKGLNNIGVFSYCGSNLNEIALRSMKEIYRHKPKLVIYMGGIVDLTKKDPTTKALSIRYTNSAKMVDHMVKSMDAIRYLLKSVFPNMVVIFAGVCGADLHMYTRKPGISPEQDVLDSSILELNRAIRHNNLLAEVPHPYFTSKVHKWMGGRCHHRYHLLFDGLHPGQVVIKQWVGILAGLHQEVIGQ